MDEFLGLIGGLFALALLVAGVTVGGLLVTSHAVLISERETPQNFSPFECTYFTGTRTITTAGGAFTGCARFIKVGE